MKHTTRLSFAAIAVLGLVLFGARSAAAAEIVLKDSKMLAAFDSDTGALVRMQNLETGWVMHRRPELGVSFRLHAPLADRRDNYVFGQKQRAAKAGKISESEVRFRWMNLVSEHGGTLPIVFDATVTLASGKLRFYGAKGRNIGRKTHSA